MSDHDTVLRAVRFDKPEAIPLQVGLSEACPFHYPTEALDELIDRHPLLFPDPDAQKHALHNPPAPWRSVGVRHVDSWGCAWETAEHGYTGAVVDHALSSWDDLDNLTPPDPEHHAGWTTIDWDEVDQRFERCRREGRFCSGSLQHGHTFLRLTYLRGYENVILDMADDEPRLARLVEMVEAFNRGLVERYLQRGADWMGYPEDLGMQRGPMLSPGQFDTWIVPSYRRLMAPAARSGAIVHMHSDGDIRALSDALLALPIDVLNLQDLVNGIDWIEAHLKGRVCVQLDIDRQDVTVRGTPSEIDRMIRHAVETLGSPQGGLMLQWGMYPPTPLENARAVMDAMERYAGYWS